MRNLNPDQFGPPPDLESYNNYDDYLQDKRRYDQKLAQGKSFRDPDEAIVAKKRKAEETQAKEEFKPIQQARNTKRKQVNQTLNTVSKTLSAFGMKKPTKRRWK